MTPLRPRVFAALAALLAAAATAHAQPAPPAVRDGAGLFSADGCQKADELLQDIHSTYNLDFVVETVAAPPEDQRDRLKHMKSREVAAFLKEWAGERAADEGVDGVYVLICTNPTSVQVAVRPEGAHADLFKEADQRRLHDALANGLKKGTDKALLAALERARSDIHHNLYPPPTFDWRPVGYFIGGVLALWLVLGLVRTWLHKPDPAAVAAGTGRPGFLPGLLGGMFGSAAGHWIYDTLFFGGPHTPADAAPAAEPAPALPVEEPADAAAAPPPAAEPQEQAPTHW
jgi:hypothetical protein